LVQISDTICHRWQMCFFGAMICQLSEGLGATNAHADGDTRPLPDALPNLLAIGHEVPVKARQVKEGFINAVDLLLWRELGDDRVHALAHVAIEGVVTALGDDAVLFGEVFEFEPGYAHGHPQRFDFSATGNHTAIVVGQNNYRLPLQFGLEDPFAGDVEVVPVYESNGCHD